MKAVLVTGGTTRIGAAISARLCAGGWRVLATSHRVDAGADIVADLAKPTGADALYDAAMRLLGGRHPDALVNNAALFTGDATALRAVNLDAPKRLTERMAAREESGGAVVNILDCKALKAPAPTATPYLLTKWGLLRETLSSARAFAKTLRVNAVAPGPVLAPTEVHEKAGRLLLHRRPSAEEVASVVAFLLSSASITGVSIPVDSGQHLLED